MLAITPIGSLEPGLISLLLMVYTDGLPVYHFLWVHPFNTFSMSTFLAGSVKGINWIWEMLDLMCQVITNIELMMVKKIMVFLGLSHWSQPWWELNRERELDWKKTWKKCISTVFGLLTLYIYISIESCMESLWCHPLVRQSNTRFEACITTAVVKWFHIEHHLEFTTSFETGFLHIWMCGWY